MSTKPPTVDDIVDDAWELIVQVIQTGEFVPKESKIPHKLDPSDVIDLAMKLSSKKLAKPRGVTIPEDFRLPKTTVDD